MHKKRFKMAIVKKHKPLRNVRCINRQPKRYRRKKRKELVFNCRSVCRAQEVMRRINSVTPDIHNPFEILIAKGSHF
jgi:hypothetical protein